MDSPEKEILEEIQKAKDWYSKRYLKTFEVRQRYDKDSHHWSWQIVAEIGGQQRGMQFGVSEKTAQSALFPMMKAKLFDHIKQSLIKAQTKWEPHLLPIYKD